MRSMFDPIMALLTPDTFAAVGKRLGISGDLVHQGVDIAIPLLTRGVADVASTPEGQVSIAEAVKNADTGVLGNLSGFAGSFAPDGGNDVLQRLFGDETRVVTAGIKEATGMDITPVLAMAAPLLLGFLNSTAQKEGLDTNGLVKKLRSEARSFDRAKSERAVLVDSVLDQVEAVRKLKSSYSASEWAAMRSGPLAVAAPVISASPSSAKRSAEELAAAVAAVAEASTSFGTTSLMAALFHNGIADVAADEISDPIGSAKTAVALVQKTSPSEIDDYKKLLMNTAYAAAQAVKEGGFLGVGSKQVSKEEQAVIDQVAIALGA